MDDKYAEYKPTADQAPIGSGMAAKAVDTIRLRKAYRSHVLEEQVKGNQPQEFEDWIKLTNG